MKIAFLDHDLNHSHATGFLKLLRELPEPGRPEVALAWDSHPSGEDWCAAQGVARAGSLEAAVAGSDAIMLLAPDHIAEHLPLFQRTAAALPRPKPVYIDKYLHPTLAGAQEIAALARRRGIPIASGSALWFSPALERALPEMAGARTCAVSGYGPLWQYAIHTVAMGMRIMGPGLTRVIDTGTNEEARITAEFGDRKLFAHVVMAENSYQVFPWTFSAFCPSAQASCGFVCVAGQAAGGHFENLIRTVAKFLADGQGYVSEAEMLDTVALLELAEASRRANGVWLERPR